MTEIKWLRIVVGVMGAFAVVTGAISGLGGIDGLGAVLRLGLTVPEQPGWLYVDNQYRFFAMLWLGIGVALLANLRRLDTRDSAPLVRWLMIIVFLGGVARVGGFIAHGLPLWHTLVSAGLELVLCPIIAVWHPRALARLTPS